eukprot:9493036-Heterocapsa_arctica.AAC.1
MFRQATRCCSWLLAWIAYDALRSRSSTKLLGFACPPPRAGHRWRRCAWHSSSAGSSACSRRTRWTSTRCWGRRPPWTRTSTRRWSRRPL